MAPDSMAILPIGIFYTGLCLLGSIMATMFVVTIYVGPRSFWGERSGPIARSEEVGLLGTTILNWINRRKNGWRCALRDA